VYPIQLYNQSFYTRDELIKDIRSKVDPAGLTAILGAYEMAHSVHEYQMRSDATPYFWHISRVVKIMIRELELYNSDVISAAYLHDVLEDSDIITADVIKYNFGAYVAHIVEVLTKNIKLMGIMREQENHQYIERLSYSSIDCKIIKLLERLDNYRCLEFGVKRNPFKYIEETEQYYFPMAEKEKNAKLDYIMEAMSAIKGKLFA
jgi:(p)ppGpp synthase/HD superfamily hydrolase